MQSYNNHNTKRCEKLEGLSPPAFKSGGATAPPAPPSPTPLSLHSEKEGNLYQLLTAWSGDCAAIKSWIEEGKYEIVNELITLMGHKILRQLLACIKCCVPSWYAVIIVDKATDVACREQMNLSDRYVDNDYTISEDSIGLFYLPNTSGTPGADRYASAL